jgi:pimeloyl-ACP methyl ester carboxylesterase
MKSKLLIISLFLLGLSSFSQGNLPVPIDAIVNKSFSQKSNVQEVQNLPYPIIFIHGLNSNDKTWDIMSDFLTNTYGLTSGGYIDVCLNYDGDNSKANTSIYPASGADIAFYTNINPIRVGDFYFVNFDINNLGELYPFDNSHVDILSNEAAIAKQGVALKYIIQMILQKTGKSKVILMGHSMGGLASREYLQNSSDWQSDGNHHIAKLVTTGTPHGGYEGLVFNIPNNAPIDYQSEAYRDLRHDFNWSVSKGVFLYGGIESSSNMTNNLLYPFYNLDVNCNGTINENVIGLNQRILPVNTVDFSYIIGLCTRCYASDTGDGVVREYNANLSNFYTFPSPKNEFYYYGSSNIQIHTDLPKQTYENMQGLDEPNEYNLAYSIELNKKYMGFTTVQPIGGYNYDYDDYTFNLTSASRINVAISNITLPLKAKLVDINGNSSVDINSIGTNITFSADLPAGKYFLVIFGAPTATSYLYPYTFQLTPSALSVNDLALSKSFMVFPNPTTSKVFFDNLNYNFQNVSVINSLGQEVSKIKFTTFLNNQEIDLSGLSAGVYVLKFSNDEMTKTTKIVKQ